MSVAHSGNWFIGMKQNNLTKLAQQGFTLLEVLITIVILSVGLLGVANLQMLGLNYNNNAYHRSQAVQLAYDIVERMRMNMDGVTAGNYTNGSTAANNAQTITFYSSGSISTAPSLGTRPSCDKDNFCSAADLATYDLYQWRDAINAALPKLQDEDGDPTTTASITALGGNRYSIAVNWGEKVENIDNDNVFEDNFEARNFTTFVQLNNL